MSGTVRVFVNTSILDLPAGADVSQAVRAYSEELAASVASGAAYVTDARGIEIERSTPLTSGDILRIVVRARRGVDADA